MMSMDAIVAELNAHLTDAARDVINAAQTILKGNQDDIRNLCRRWGVQLKLQKRYRPMETTKQELKCPWQSKQRSCRVKLTLLQEVLLH